MALWLGLFAMLMIHVGPLISATQALLLVEPVSMQANTASVTAHAHVHAEQYVIEPNAIESIESRHAGHGVDYHALMGHHSASAGAPQWLANLEMCGYCDLLTISPPLILVLLWALPILPPVQWLTMLPAPQKCLPPAYSIRHPRAPPLQLFA